VRPDQRWNWKPRRGGKDAQGDRVSEEDEQPTSRRSDPNEPDRPADNSLGRLLTLSDGIFAISMTLLALDLQVPNLGNHPSDASLRHALAANDASYLSFLLTFYVVAGY
jgi:hypothetical protein